MSLDDDDAQWRNEAIGRLLDAFAAGDYATSAREAEPFCGHSTTIEVALIRLVSLQRLRQHRTAELLASRLLRATADSPYYQALIQVCLGHLRRDDVLQHAASANERCQAIYHAAARLVTEHGFAAGRSGFEECVAIETACFEQMVARRELAAAEATPSAIPSPISSHGWNVDELIANTYHVRMVIDEGAMSIVYLVWHTTWNTELALKVPRPQSLNQPQTWSRLTSEATTWVDLGVHPNIVAAHYVRRINDIPCIVMEKVDGGTLRSWLESGQAADLRTALDIAIQIATGLEYASTRQPGFVHRDIKPANILMTSDGVAKIADFGLANAYGKRAGTPAYMAPEIWLNPSAVGPPADMYSFGCVLYALLTGRHPFQCRPIENRFQSEVSESSEGPSGEGPAEGASPSEPSLNDVKTVISTKTQPADRQPAPREFLATPYRMLMEAHLNQVPEPPHVGRPEIPVELSGFCLRLLGKNPADRPSAPTARRELVAFFAAATGEPYPRPAPEANELLADSLNNHALSMIDLGMEEQAVALWDQALAADGQHFETIYNSGLRAWRAAKITDSDFLESLDSPGRSSRKLRAVAYAYALLHLERGSALEALEQLDRIEADPLDAELSIARATAETLRAESPASLVLEGHENGIASLSVSPDGQSALSASHDKTLKVWSITEGRCLQTLSGHGGIVTEAAVDENWSTAISIDFEGVLKHWRISDGQCLRSIQAGQRGFGSLALSRDGALAVTGTGFPPKLQSWDLPTGQCLKQFVGHAHPINAISLTSDKAALFTTDWTTFRRWQVSNGTSRGGFEIGRCPLPRRPIRVHADGSMLAAKNNVDLALTDVGCGPVRQHFKGHKDAIFDIAWPDSSKAFVSCGGDATVRYWDMLTGRCLRTFRAEGASFTAVAFNATKRIVVAGTDQGSIFAWRLPANSFKAPLLLSRPPSGERLLEVSRVVQNAAAAATAALEGNDLHTAINCLREAREKPECARHPRLLELWFELYSRCTKTGLRGAWLVGRVVGHTTFIQSIRRSGDGRRALSAARNCSLNVWDLKASPSLQLIRQCSMSGEGTSPSPSEMTWCADIDSDGARAVTAGIDGCVRVWDLESGSCKAVLRGHRSRALCVRFAGPRRVVSSGSDAEVRIWDLNDSRCLHVLKGHSDAITAMDVSRDGRLLATTGEDQTIRVWDLTSATCIQCFGAEESGPLLDRKFHLQLTMHLPAAISGSGIRALTTEEVDYMHRPVRLRQKRALALAFDGMGKRLVRALGTKLEIWDLDPTPRQVSEIDAHQAVILAALITPDGKFAISSGTDRFLKFWDLKTRRCVASFQTREEVWSLSLSEEGRSLLGGGFGDINEWLVDWDLSVPGEKPLAETNDASSVESSEDADALHAVLEAFLRGDEASRQAACEQIGKIPFEQWRSIRSSLVQRTSELTQLIENPNRKVQTFAGFLLATTGSHAIEPFCELLKSPKTSNRLSALQGLAAMGAAAECCIPQIFDVLPHSESDVWLKASHTLFSIGPKAIPMLITALEASDWQMRMLALLSLEAFGPMATIALPDLRRVRDKSRDVAFCRGIDRVIERIEHPDRPAASAQPPQAAGPHTVGPQTKSSARGLLLGCGLPVLAVAVLIGFAAWQSARENKHYEQNLRPRANVRSAEEILRMWTSGVRIENEPYVRPAYAVQLLNDAIHSQADEAVKSQAQSLLNSMKRYPNYFRFVQHLDQFTPLLRDVKWTESKQVAAAAPVPKLAPDFLVATIRSARSPGPEKTAVLEADMLEACGEFCVASPDRLKTLVTLDWSVESIGRREVVGINASGKIAKLPDEEAKRLNREFILPQLRRRCDIKAFDFKTRRVLGGWRLELTEPNQVTLFGKGEDLDRRLREAVRNFLVRLTRSDMRPQVM